MHDQGKQRMAPKTVDYKAKAKALTGLERERTLSRMAGKLPKRLAKDKLSENEALAIQLELEDEQLAEWRDKVAKMREKGNKK